MSLLDLLYPRVCEGCGGEPPSQGGHLCWDCLMRAEFISDPMCARCGDPVDGVVDHAFQCAWCCRTEPVFERARSVVRLRGAMRKVLHQFKYNRATHLSADLGALLGGCVRAMCVDTDPPDAIACVPLHPARLRERGYNQSMLLARQLGKHLALPVMYHALKRIRFTQTQTHLNAEQRKENVRGAFRVPDPSLVDGRRWLLVDDVMTTGATVDACARALMRQGAVAVTVVTVARG